MKKIDSAITELNEMDDLAVGESPVHRLNAAVKFIAAVLYIVVTVSFGKYDLAGLMPMILYPVVMFQLAGLSVSKALYRLRIVLPLVCAVGLFNPFLDKAALLTVGSVRISGGVISMITLMLKGIFCVTASYVLAATTPFDRICAALRKMHVPGFFVTLMLLTYRYISVMMQEVSVMTDAYSLRAPGQKGVVKSAWGSFLGQLLLRSMDRAEELYSGMKLRGFDGNFVYADPGKCGAKDYMFLLVTTAAFLIFRFVDIAALLGGLVV